MSRDPDCIFCKIVSVELPAAVVYEDGTVLVFLDVAPLSEGHLLMVPRDHYSKLSQVPPEVCGTMGALLPALGRALMQVTGVDGYNVLVNEGQVAGQVVPHVHVHLIGRKADDGLGYRWNAGGYPPGRASDLAAAFQKALADRNY